MKASPAFCRAQRGVTRAQRASVAASCSAYGVLSTACSSRTTEQSPFPAASYASAAIQLRRMYLGLASSISARRSAAGRASLK